MYKLIWGVNLPNPLKNTNANDPKLIRAKEMTQEEIKKRAIENGVINQKEDKRGSWSTQRTTKTLRIKISKNSEENTVLVPHSDLIVHKKMDENGKIVDNASFNKKKRSSSPDTEKSNKKKKTSSRKVKPKSKERSPSPTPPKKPAKKEKTAKKKTPVKKTPAKKKEATTPSSSTPTPTPTVVKEEVIPSISDFDLPPSPKALPTAPSSLDTPINNPPKIKIKFKIPKKENN